MRRYTIYYRFGDSFLPMINCRTLKDVAVKLVEDDDRPGFKVFDNHTDQWVSQDVVFLACAFSTKES